MLPHRSIRAIEYNTLDDRVARKLAIKQVARRSQGNEGLDDIALGSIASLAPCGTCQKKVGDCMGHHGVIEYPFGITDKKLSAPTLRKIIKALCFVCEAVRSPAPSAALSSLAGRKCASCGAAKIDKVDLSSGLAIITDEAKHKWTLFLWEIKNILDSQDLRIKKILDPHGSDPGRFIHRTIIVPARTMRPPYQLGNGQWSPSPIGQTLQSILAEVSKNLEVIDICAELRYRELLLLTHPPDLIPRLHRLLSKINYHIDVMMYGKPEQRPEHSQRGAYVGKKEAVLKSLTGKAGMMRGKMSGYILTSIARMVIACDNTIPDYVVEVPTTICERLYVEEVVRPYNVGFLTDIVRGGRYAAVRKRNPGGTSYRIIPSTHFNCNKDLLSAGDQVLRYLADGDIVMINRQPTLDIDSMGAMVVKVCRDRNIRTLRQNVLACRWLRSDFDGDQVNIIPGIRPDLALEMELMSSYRNLMVVSPTKAYCTLLFLQNCLDGAYHLTKNSDAVSQYAHEIVQYTSLQYIPNDRRTGRELIAAALDTPLLNYRNGEVEIREGQVVSGVLTKRSLGAGPNSLFQQLYYTLDNPQRFSEVVFILQSLCQATSYFFLTTLKMKDLMISVESYERKQAELGVVVQRSIDYAVGLLTDPHRSIPLGESVAEFHERQQVGLLSIPDELITSTYDQIAGTLRTFVESGQGDGLNTVKQTYVGLGQLLNHGKRFKEHGLSYARPSQYAFRFDLSPIHRGFVDDCYMIGLSHVAFYHATHQARGQVIDRQEGTTKAGYHNRRITLACQPAVTGLLCNVTFNGVTLQNLFGGDGLDVTRYYPTEPEFGVSLSLDDYDQTYNHGREFYDSLCNFQKRYRTINSFMRESWSNDVYLLLPFDMNIEWAAAVAGLPPPPPVKSRRTRATLALPSVDLHLLIRRVQKAYALVHLDYVIQALEGLRIYVGWYLTRARIGQVGVTNWPIVENALTMAIYNAYSNALVSRREAVGYRAAVSCTDPLTQAMLSSHKHEGSSATNVGIFDDLLIKSSTKETTSRGKMYVFLKPEFADAVEYIAELMKEVQLSTFSPLYDVVDERRDDPDQGWLRFYDPPPVQLTTTSLRILLDMEKMIRHRVNELDIIRGLIPVCTQYQLFPVASFGHDQYVVRLFLTTHGTPGISDIYAFFLNTLTAACDRSVVRGVSGIRATKVVNTSKDPLIVTDGTNIRGCCATYGPAIDMTRLASTNKAEMEEIFGIYVTERMIRSVLTNFDDNGRTPKRKLISVISSVVGMTGTCTPLVKSGIEKRQGLSSVEHLMLAADPITSLSKAHTRQVVSQVRNLTGLCAVGSAPSYNISGSMGFELLINEEMIASVLRSRRTVFKKDPLLDDEEEGA